MLLLDYYLALSCEIKVSTFKLVLFQNRDAVLDSKSIFSLVKRYVFWENFICVLSASRSSGTILVECWVGDDVN